MPGPRRDIRTGNYLCGWAGCNQPAFQNLYVYCRTHFDHAVEQGHYVPRILSIISAPQPQPQREIPHRPDPLRPGFYLCLSPDCPYPTYNRFAYCRAHFEAMDMRGQIVPTLGEPAVAEPKKINQYQWFARGFNDRGNILHYFEGDPHNLQEILKYAGGIRPVTSVLRGLEKHVYHKTGSRIRGPMESYQAVITGTALAKTFNDQMKTPRQYHRELAEVLRSGVRVGMPTGQPPLNFEEEVAAAFNPVPLRVSSRPGTFRMDTSAISSSIWTTGPITSGSAVYTIPRPISPAEQAARAQAEQAAQTQQLRSYADLVRAAQPGQYMPIFYEDNGRVPVIDHSDEADREE